MAGPEPAPDAEAVVAFWRAAGPRRWFAADPAFDAQVRARLEDVSIAAARRELDVWADTAPGALALILLLDQVPRNIWRGSARAFEADPAARRVARAALAAGHDQATPRDLRGFFYLPFSHAEDLAEQDLAVALAEALERAGGPSARSARRHRELIRRFGRFPRRNAALARVSTPAEEAFLVGGTSVD